MDQRFELELGLQRLGFILGCGTGPKLVTCSFQKWIKNKQEKENKKLKRKVKEDRKVMSEMGLRLEYLKS